MTTFALLHGAWHGAWCWSAVGAALEAEGHDVVAVDLPCDEVDATFSTYADVIIEALNERGDDVVLVGFRAFQISPELQERYGYPALTDEIKAKVFGLNAAELFGLDVEATRCGLDADALTAARAEHASMVRDGAIPAPWEPRGQLSRREVLASLRNLRAPWTP